MNDEDLKLLLTVIARSIGRTVGVENHLERARDVVRSIRENDLTLPTPHGLIAPLEAASALEFDDLAPMRRKKAGNG